MRNILRLPSQSLCGLGVAWSAFNSSILLGLIQTHLPYLSSAFSFGFGIAEECNILRLPGLYCSCVVRSAVNAVMDKESTVDDLIKKLEENEADMKEIEAAREKIDTERKNIEADSRQKKAQRKILLDALKEAEGAEEVLEREKTREWEETMRKAEEYNRKAIAIKRDLEGLECQRNKRKIWLLEEDEEVDKDKYIFFSIIASSHHQVALHYFREKVEPTGAETEALNSSEGGEGLKMHKGGTEDDETEEEVSDQDSEAEDSKTGRASEDTGETEISFMRNSLSEEGDSEEEEDKGECEDDVIGLFGEIPYNCIACGEGFESEQRFMAHLASKHYKTRLQKEYGNNVKTCPICGSTYARSINQYHWSCLPCNC